MVRSITFIFCKFQPCIAGADPEISEGGAILVKFQKKLVVFIFGENCSFLAFHMSSYVLGVFIFVKTVKFMVHPQASNGFTLPERTC